MTQLYDILIYNYDTQRVNSIAAYRVTSDQAVVNQTEIGIRLAKHMKAMSVPTGEYLKGDFISIDRPETSMPVPRKMGVIQRRQADCVCIICESPNLYTRQHCEQHAAENAQKTSRGNR